MRAKAKLKGPEARLGWVGKLPRAMHPCARRAHPKQNGGGVGQRQALGQAVVCKRGEPPQ